MKYVLKLFFLTEDGIRILTIANPREDITMDEAKTAMETIVASGAFSDLTGVQKAVLYSSDTEIIYEA